MNLRSIYMTLRTRLPGYLPGILLGVLSIAACIILAWIYIGGASAGDIVLRDMAWKKKDEEAISRLLAVPLLLYHNIDGRGEYSLNYEVMEAQFQLLADRGIEVVALDDFVKRLDNPRPYEKKVAVLSFDDGYLSMYTRLMPLLARFGYHVTLFVYTDNVYHSARRNITWQKLREMQNSGFDIQSHTLSHPDLVRLARKGGMESRHKLYEEIYLSKRVLELYLGREVRYFAFPYGSYNLELVDLCKQAGFARVFSTDFGPNIITRNNYCLRRRHIKSDYGLEKVAGLVE